jgi:hypothetical protein
MKIRDVQPGDLHSEPNLYRTLEHSISVFIRVVVGSAKGVKKIILALANKIRYNLCSYQSAQAASENCSLTTCTPENCG